MAASSGFKELLPYASICALGGLGVFVPYTLSELSKIKTEQEEIKKHLAALIGVIDPEGKRHVEQIIKAVQILDNRLAKTQEDLEVIGKTPQITAPKRERTQMTYQRLTKRAEPTPSIQGSSVGAKMPEVTAAESDDLDADIEAMK